ncbi:MAG: response regulator [Ferruginibacter sp.]|nr:response regulator [Ferruginibacter sp.]
MNELEQLNCIMVIDDDEPTNFLNTMLIEDANCTKHLRIVESGLKALDYFENLLRKKKDIIAYIPPDLVFLDINMPCMNGWEFLEEYRNLQNEQPHRPVIIMLTTSLDPEDRVKAANIPEVAGFENKPLTSEMIDRLIKTHFAPTGYGRSLQ